MEKMDLKDPTFLQPSITQVKELNLNMQSVAAESDRIRLNRREGSGFLAKLIISALLSLLLVGCASRSSRDLGWGVGGNAGGELTIVDYLDTYLPRASYMAKFEILPNGSAALLYPIRESDQGRTEGGTHHMGGVPPSFVKAQRDLFSPRITGLLNQSPRAIRDVTLLVVAADRPLNLAQFLKNPTALRDHLLAEGCTTEMASLDEILSVVLPNSRETLWEYDARRVRVDRLWAFSG